MTHFKIVRRMLDWSQINPPAPEPVEVYDLYEGCGGFIHLLP